MLKTISFTVEPLSEALGAEIVGLDLRQDLPPQTVGDIISAWHEHLVLLFRNQSLSEEDQIRFARHFGALQQRTRPPEARNEECLIKHPELTMLVSNIRENGKLIGSLPDGEMHFHSDQCYLEKPAKGTFLYAIEIPSEGGDTLFLNMYHAYEMLPEGLKSRVDGRKARNAYLYDLTTRERNAAKIDLSVHPHFVQPIVRTHPDTGRKALYVNRLMTSQHRRYGGGRRGRAPRRALRPYRAGPVHLCPSVAGGRPRFMGQPMHLARTHGFQRQGTTSVASCGRCRGPRLLRCLPPVREQQKEHHGPQVCNCRVVASASSGASGDRSPCRAAPGGMAGFKQSVRERAASPGQRCECPDQQRAGLLRQQCRGPRAGVIRADPGIAQTP